MCEMTAHAQIQTEDRITRLQNGQQESGVGLCAAMWLYVGIFAIEYFFQTIDGELLDLVDDLAATIISPSGITFRVFIGKYRAHRLHNLQGGEIFRSDQFDPMTLTLQLFPDE